MSLTDISGYGVWIALAGVIIAAVVGGVATYFKLKKKKPRLELVHQSSSWTMRQESSIVTDVYVTLLLQNKGEAPTTINGVSIRVIYQGTVHLPVSTPVDNIMLEPGASIPKQFVFNVPRKRVEIWETIGGAIIEVKHTYGTKSIEIADIKQQ